MGFKVENVEVSTYGAEPGTASDYVQLYLNRISNALVKLSSNFTIESPVEQYAAEATSAACLASTVQLKCTNSENPKYIRMWFFAYCSSSSSTNANLKYNLVTVQCPSYSGSNLNVHANNIYIGGHYYYSSGKYKIPFIPSGLAIGVSNSPINSNLGQDLNLDIPLFGFNCHNTAYNISNGSTAAIVTSPFRYIICDSMMGLTANLNSSHYQWMFHQVTGGGVNKFTVGTDGSAFYIADKVLLGGSLDYPQNHVCFYAPDMFDNYDENDKRTDGAFCVSEVHSTPATKGVFASYVDINGSPLSIGSVTEFNLLSGAVNSSQSNDIVYTSAHPILTTSSYSDPLVFNSLSVKHL